MQREIGNVFRYNYATLEVVEAVNKENCSVHLCIGCAYASEFSVGLCIKDTARIKRTGVCSASKRIDNKHVYFKRIS
jgi:hypothetical protein